ncbi:hypothetical protein [Nannocystis bainbridge]|uniref:Uncharacterized protein n=1 Tax=Nannocystis bainbridge TaxID=2995303 RepID=A0ABT5E4B2_9BACT|nr:hypothetical protein [Nannocystis bainbridge]MDC0720681.1 hypothetical protein [Nannocystis bainbridge]
MRAASALVLLLACGPTPPATSATSSGTTSGTTSTSSGTTSTSSGTTSTSSGTTSATSMDAPTTGCGEPTAGFCEEHPWGRPTCGKPVSAAACVELWDALTGCVDACAYIACADALIAAPCGERPSICDPLIACPPE